MKTDLNSIFGKEELISDFDKVEKVLKKNGKVFILSNESLYELSITNIRDLTKPMNREPKLTLIEAIIKMLKTTQNNTMHSKDLANEITKEELFFRKDGSFVTAIQVRACASNNPKTFECLKGNMIKLK